MKTTPQGDALGALLGALDLAHIAVSDVHEINVSPSPAPGRARFRVAYVDPEYRALDEIVLIRPVVVNDEAGR